MADLGFSLNTEELPEAKEFVNTPVPAGKYTVLITNSKLMPTKKTKQLMAAVGSSDYEQFRKANPSAEGYLVLEMDIQDNGQAGRKLFHNLNLINDSEEARNIAAGQLKQILSAFKMTTFSGKSEELHDKRLVVDVTVKPPKPYMDNGVQKPGFPSNNCVKFSAPGAVATSAATQVAGSTEKKSPWAR